MSIPYNTMSPGLPKAYKEKTVLRLVKCDECKHVMATRMKIPQCSKCRTYIKGK